MPAEHARLIASFLDAQSAERNAALNTLRSYQRDLERFAQSMARKGQPLLSVAQPDLAAYLVDLEAEGLAASSRARHLSALKQFYRFLFEEELRADNPTIGLTGPKKPRSLPKILEPQDVEAILKASGEVGRTPFETTRNICLMQMLYATGLRASELVSLPRQAVQLKSEVILVRGKGGRERMVPLSPAARLSIAAYLPERDQRFESPEAAREKSAKYLFPSRGKEGHMSRVRLYLLIKEIAVKAGLDPARVTPHVIRHAFATHLLGGGADLRVIQILLGHADIATTEIYTHVLRDELRDLLETHHPLAKEERSL